MLPPAPEVTKPAALTFPVTDNTLLLALNEIPVVLTLASWLLPEAPTITGYSVVELVLSVALIMLLGPVAPWVPKVPCVPVAPCVPTIP